MERTDPQIALYRYNLKPRKIVNYTEDTTLADNDIKSDPDFDVWSRLMAMGFDIYNSATDDYDIEGIYNSILKSLHLVTLHHKTVYPSEILFVEEDLFDVITTISYKGEQVEARLSLVFLLLSLLEKDLQLIIPKSFVRVKEMSHDRYL